MDPSFTQDINFKGSQVEFSVGIIAQDVRIKCSAGDHDHGSSKMKLTDMVDFNWGLRVCPGHLIAIHRTGQYIAYGLKTREHGMVRVLNTVTKEKTLIKGVRGLIYDIAFAFCTQEILLSFVDEEGTLYVYEIIADAAKTELKHKLVVQLSTPQSQVSVRSNSDTSCGSSSSSRVTWCPYVPSYGEDEASCAEHSKLLVLLRMGGSAEVVDVGVLARAGIGGVFADDRPVDGYVRLDECHSSVVDASFSPDGTALATAGQDGFVKFFQVFLRDGERPRCLHEWRPHDGKALSSLLFLDNINTYGTDCKFWKFAVTGALNNSELKVWSCETWTCTQTIVFHADPRASSPDLYLKARLDDTGTYLILTETNNRLLYVLQVRRDDDVQHAAIENVAEFLLPAACISFCVRTATLGLSDIDATILYGMDGNNGKKQLQQRGGYLTVDQLSMDDDSDLLDEDLLDDDYRDMSISDNVHIHMYLMQTKCLQECRLVFRPEIITADDTITSIITNKPPLSVDLKLDDLQTSVQQLIIKQQQQQQEFSTDDKEPNNFASDIDVAPCLSSVGNGDNSNILLFIGETNVDVDVDVDSTEVIADHNASLDKVVVVDNLIDIDLATSGSASVISNPSNSQVVERNFASGGSSPSREVQEILLSLSVSSSSSQSHHQQQHVSNTNNPATATTSTSLQNNTAAATYTPKQFFDSLTKLQQQHKDNIMATPDWSDIPKVSNIKLVQLEQEQQHSSLEVRLEALENTLRLHTAKLSAERQQLMRSKSTDDIIAALAIQEQRIATLLEQHSRSIEATVQTALTAAQSKPVTPAVAMIDSTALSTAVQQEFKSAIVPLVQATFDQLHRSLDAQHAQKLCHLENLLRSNVQRLFSQCSQNKALTEALNSALVQMIRPGLETQYRDFMATSLVPAWEKVCEAMFQQIHATFTQGTQEYCGAMERYCLEQQRQQQQVQQQVDVSGQQMQAQVSCAFNRLEVALADVVRDEVRTGLKQLQKLNRSSGDYNDGGSDAGGKRAPTPAVQHLQQQQQQVKRLLNRGGRSAICEAFQVALSAAAAASDTALVLYVCERVPVHEVFCSPAADPSTRVECCILPQHVLLSLIQQLSADLTQHTDLKHRYLEESLLNLDMKSSVTKEHGSLVLRDLLKQLASFLAAYPTHASTRSMRMLHMVTQSYVLSSAADLT